MISCSSDPTPVAPVEDAGSDAVGLEDASTATDALVTDALPDYRSGKRLHAKVTTADDASLFIGWHDVGLDVDCAFGIAEDNKLRCLPRDQAYAFSDADCKQPAFTVTSGCTAPKYVTTFAPACNDVRKVMRVGAKLAVTTTYSNQSGTCQPNTATTTEDIYAASEAVNATELVAASPTRQPRGARLAMDFLVAEDGAVQALSAFDTTRKASCSIDSSGFDKTLTCLPELMAFEEVYFSDSTCQSPIALFPHVKGRCDDPPSAVLRNINPPACGHGAPTFAEPGAKVMTSSSFRKGVGTCEQATFGIDDSLYAIGAAIPLGSLPALTETDDGNGRIKLRAVRSETGERLAARTLVDTERKEECRATRVADGSLRCIPPPSGDTGINFFSDTECKKPLALAIAGCKAPAFVQLSTAITPDCSGSSSTRVFQVGAKVTPAMVYFPNGGPTGTCVSVALPSNSDLYDAATEVPASAFAAVTAKTE